MVVTPPRKKEQFSRRSFRMKSVAFSTVEAIAINTITPSMQMLLQ